ncbi:TPA: phage tail protein [Klebsiella pneumoniae]|uniref:phage tail protein n=1 Tax=Klebsiella pneumoniae TaxID=573 RepID=UPI000B40B91D|nr:phage tail protein [Klebsiella pneumoniae]OVV21869.1 hypothetical protein BME84_13700 [Klebsiella pneumoniae]QMC30489.1 phage tail protein [Klebsiella pneumoniae]STU87757.1 phage-related tail protein [Klebsiella pneumoniae]HCT2688160.1 phage tail protein [Klebsiella pneumoniae]HDH0899156.1 phage tail protein [Klebsiella pneumoniae]
MSNSITSTYAYDDSDYTATTSAGSANSRVMMSWGGFEFSIDNLAYKTLERSQEWRWNAQALIGKSDLLQYTGKGARDIKLAGEAHARFKKGVGITAIDDLFDLADMEEPQLLVSSAGDIFGYWVAVTFTDAVTGFMPGGGAKNRNFVIGLKFYGDKLSN